MIKILPFGVFIMLLMGCAEKKDPIFSADLSRALTSQATAGSYVEKIVGLDVYVSRQRSISPVVGEGNEASLIFHTTDKAKIANFFSNLWSGTVRQQWDGEARSLAIIVNVGDLGSAYFHTYLMRGQNVLISPYTGQDPATYDNSSIVLFLEEEGVSIP